jgi:hypothetical protein
MQLAETLFLLTGLFFSLFYGIRSYYIFTFPRIDDKERERYRISITMKLHNFFVNFTGSAIGWISLYVLYKDIFSSGLAGINIGRVSFGHMLLLFVAILGIWGILPHTFWGLAESAKYIAEKALGRLK